MVSRFLDQLKGANVEVKYMRCDNAGENCKQVQEECEKRGVTIEFTAPHTPQMNGIVERKFVTIRNRAHAMMLGACLDVKHQGILWAEAVNTATILCNGMPNSHSPKSPDELWYGEPSTVLRAAKHRWGTIGYVTLRTKTNKLENKSVKCVFVGYADGHSRDTF